MFAIVSMVKRHVVMNIDYAIKWEISGHLPKKRQSYYRDYLLDSFNACKEYSSLTEEERTRIKAMFRQDSMETLWSALYKLKTCEHTIQIDNIEVTYEKALRIVENTERCEYDFIGKMNKAIGRASVPLKEIQASAMAALRALKEIRENEGASMFLFY